MKPVAIYYNPAFLLHDTGPHPESPARLVAIVDALNKAPFASRLVWPEFPAAMQEDLQAIHSAKHVAYIQESCLGGGGNLDPDTVVCPESWEAALLAAGAGCAAVDAVMAGQYPAAFCAVRPPGHHAEPQRAMGFCLFNNVAIAARHATRKSGAQRVAIIDFDVHHGNGTQSAFYEDPSVYFVSFHQAAIYPGTGWTEETGANQGAHTTLNFPMGPLCGDEIYLESLRNVVFPKLSEFRPELILLSAGFDAHQSDPIGGMAITTEGFYRITSAIKSFADQTCGGKVVSLLEGGYDIKTLGDAVTAHVKALLDL